MAKYWNAPARCQPSLYEKVYSHALAAVHGLFPATCYLCLDPGQPPALDLCAGCEADLPLNSRACPVCAAPVPDSRYPCRRCRRRGREFDLAFAPYRYEFPLVELIHRMKYRGQLPIARILGSLLGRQLASRGPPGVDAIVPVPLHAARERQRGYNQAREIAVFAARELRLPVHDRLARRIRATSEQAELPAALRRGNLHGAFAIRAGWVPPRVAIVDDVLTTGATAESLALALRQAGCRSVEVWAVARA
ncbi:MAG TPA: ComF family protein [Steroidobacteraceae bacterium]|nr:ComF family protein [Steroidobacteraceae bacterium]